MGENMKIIWMNHIYLYICSSYINKNKRIDVLEAILLLMQIESIKNFGCPFYKYKTYIYDGNIRIPYLSDLLRISPIVTIPYGRHFYGPRRMDKYVNMFKKYRNISEEEVFNRVEASIKELECSNYIVLKEYRNSWMRRRARLTINEGKKGVFPYIMRIIIGMLTFVYLFGFIMLNLAIHFHTEFSAYLNHDINIEILKSTNILVFIITVILSIIWLLWTWQWIKPTRYELDGLEIK